jgi:hypothetical protein
MEYSTGAENRVEMRLKNSTLGVINFRERFEKM